MHKDLLLTCQLIYDPSGISFTVFEKEAESEEYAACTFRLNGYAVKFRVAKTTPKKTGQFVTVWKRKGGGPIEPFERSDLDFIIISCRSGDHFGQFIFPEAILLKQGIISGSNKGGKRGFRVYPPWEKTNSGQAAQTQQWQTPYFVEIQEGIFGNRSLIHEFFLGKRQ